MREDEPPRSYPARPIIGCIAVVLRGDRALLIQRAKDPNAGLWGFPGGVQEVGETSGQAALRELAEETGIRACNPRPLTPFDVIQRDEEASTGQRIRYHFVLLPFLVEWISGEGRLSDEVSAIGWYALRDLAGLPVLPKVPEVLDEALRLGKV